MIPGDQLPTQTEKKEACGAHPCVLLVSYMPLASTRLKASPIEAAVACPERLTADLQLNTVAEQPYYRIRPLLHR